jgi:hypothetical protein
MAQGKAVRPKPDEILALAEQVLSMGARGKLNDAARTRLQAELANYNFSSLRAYAGSLVEDPARAGTYYLAVDVIDANAVHPLLLMFCSGPVVVPGRFADPSMALHTHLPSGREVGMAGYQFSSYDHAAIATLARDIEPAFLPRPQRALPAIATGNRHPEISLPAAFTAFGTILEKFGVNWASTVQLSATPSPPAAETIRWRWATRAFPSATCTMRGSGPPFAPGGAPAIRRKPTTLSFPAPPTRKLRARLKS